MCPTRYFIPDAHAEVKHCMCTSCTCTFRTNLRTAAQAVAPVRETAAQALGAAVQALSAESLRVLLGQLQTLARSEQWEVRHSGLLALNYVIAARPDTAAQLLSLAVNIAAAGLQVQYIS